MLLIMDCFFSFFEGKFHLSSGQVSPTGLSLRRTAEVPKVSSLEFRAPYPPYSMNEVCENGYFSVTFRMKEEPSSLLLGDSVSLQVPLDSAPTISNISDSAYVQAAEQFASPFSSKKYIHNQEEVREILIVTCESCCYFVHFCIIF